MGANSGVLGQAAIDKILAQSGIKGMKWGVRRSRKELAKNAGRDENNPRFMSDAELRSKLNRLQMEKQYKELTKAPPSTLDKGRKFAGKIVASIAQETVKGIGKSYADQYASRFLAAGAGAKGGKSTPTPPAPGPRQGPLPPPKP